MIVNGALVGCHLYPSLFPLPFLFILRIAGILWLACPHIRSSPCWRLDVYVLRQRKCFSMSTWTRVPNGSRLAPCSSISQRLGCKKHRRRSKNRFQILGLPAVEYEFKRENFLIFQYTEHVYVPYSQFIEQQGRRWQEVGGNQWDYMDFTLAGWVTGWWARSGMVEACMTVARR